MKNHIKYIFVFAFVLTITFLTSDNNVYADTFDENYAVVSDNSLYSVAIDWSNGHNESFNDVLPDGTKIPYVLVKTVSNTSPVYAFWYYYKPYENCDYYYSGLHFVSKNSFSLEYSNRQWNTSSAYSSTTSSLGYQGYYFCSLGLSTYCDSDDVVGFGGVTGLLKDNPIETYDLFYQEYNSDIKSNKYYIHDKIVEFLNNGESDSVSSSDGRTDGDSDDSGEPDESLGHLKIKNNRMQVINQDEHQHEHNHLSFMNETDTGLNIDDNNILFQYKLEGYLTHDSGESWSNHYTTPIYKSSDNDFCHGHDNTNKDLYICELSAKYLEFTQHIYPLEERNFSSRTYVGKISVFVRPAKIVDGQIKYGAWTKCYARFNGANTESGYEDGGYDSDEDSDNDSSDSYADEEEYDDDGHAGVGYDDDSADDSADTHDNGGSSVSFDSVKDLLTKIGNVPAFISTLFSFLPSWCLNLVGAAFAMFVILMIVKIVRG